MKRHKRILTGALLALIFSSAMVGAGAPPSQQAGEEGARALLAQFLKPDADAAALTKRLMPSSPDYRAVFGEKLAAKAEATYKAAWSAGTIVIRPKDGQTELKLWAATTEELQAGAVSAREFPGAYSKIAPHLSKGLTLYRFKFVEPGKSAGLAFDGLVYVNGRFVLFPKPFHVLDQGGVEKLE